MDMHEVILTKIYSTLTADTTLKTLMGGTVRLFPDKAPPDTVFPYLVYHLDMTQKADWSLEVICPLIINIWSAQPTLDECLDIRDRLATLLDGLDTTNEGVEFWIWEQTRGPSEEDLNPRHYIYHLNLKWIKTAQIGVLLKR
jgi:Protein of unknown function (DUF3168)